jgi:hypothetical protein
MVSPQFGNQPPMPVVPGMVVAGFQQAQPYQGNPTTVTAAGGSQTTQPANPALLAIGQMLSSPNPRAMATGVGQSAFGQQTLQAGGIAGVASKLESESIKVYNDRSKYNEWEFIYDPRQDRTARAAPQQGQQPNRPSNAPDTSSPLTGPPGNNNRGSPQGPGPGFPPGMNNPGGPPQPPPGRGRGR